MPSSGVSANEAPEDALGLGLGQDVPREPLLGPRQVQIGGRIGSIRRWVSRTGPIRGAYQTGENFERT